MRQRESGWRNLPFSPFAVLHARGLKHAPTDCPFCRLGWAADCPMHPTG